MGKPKPLRCPVCRGGCAQGLAPDGRPAFRCAACGYYWTRGGDGGEDYDPRRPVAFDERWARPDPGDADGDHASADAGGTEE